MVPRKIWVQKWTCRALYSLLAICLSQQCGALADDHKPTHEPDTEGATVGSIATALRAHPPPSDAYHFDYLTGDDGLSDTAITGILQDKQGYMWFGTSWGGLNRYDGYEVEVFLHDPRNPRSLSQNNVTVMFMDHLGELWVGTQAGGLNRYDREKNDFTQYQPVPGDETSLPSGSVTALGEDQEGVLWVGTDRGLARMDRASGRFKVYHPESTNPQSLSDDVISSLYCDPDSGALWVGTRSSGACVMAKGAGGFKTYHPDLGKHDSIGAGNILSFCKDHSGVLWIGTDKGLRRFFPETGTFVHYQHEPDDKSSLSNDYVRLVYEDSQGRFWVSTGDGASEMDRENGTFRFIPSRSRDSRHLIGPAVSCICEDNTGAVWFADVEQGVSRLDRVPQKFSTVNANAADSSGLGHECVIGLLADKNDRVWVGTMGGLDYMEQGRPPVTHVRFPEGLVPRVHAVAEDGEGGYWVGAFPEGLFHLKDGELTRLPAAVNDPLHPMSDQLWAFANDPHRGVWILYWWVGVDYFDGHRFVHYPQDLLDPQRLHDGTFLGFVNDDQGILWLGGPSGLVRLDPASGVFTTFQIDENNPASERNRSIACIYADRKAPGELWVGTSYGLFEFDKKTLKFTKYYTTADGMCSNGVQAIQRDKRGNLWLGTLNGLSKFSPQENTFHNYGLVDGLSSKKFYNGAAAQTSDGKMYFGTTNGLTVFDPESMPENPVPPRVVITGFELFNKPVEIGAQGSPLTKAVNVAQEITLNYGKSVFTFKFAALNFTAPEKNRYAYKMEGFDDDWRYTDSKRRFATYTRLAPGTYNFRVKASNNDGVWNQQGVSLRVVILPPWWRTWWAITAGSVCVVAGAYTAYRFRIRDMARHNQELAREVAARTKDLTEKSAALESAIKELESFSYSVSHDLKAPLRIINGFSRILVEDHAAKLDGDGRETVERIQAAVTRMDALIDNILRLSKIGRSEMRLSKVDLSEKVRQIAAELTQADPQRCVTFLIEPGCEVVGDAPLLRIAMVNILSNAWKYTAKTAEAKIEFASAIREGERIYFVRDNGCGFDMKYADKLFGVFQRLHNVRDYPGIGIGLTSVRRVIERHGGRAWIEGKVDEGATFYFTLPPKAVDEAHTSTTP